MILLFETVILGVLCSEFAEVRQRHGLATWFEGNEVFSGETLEHHLVGHAFSRGEATGLFNQRAHDDVGFFGLVEGEADALEKVEFLLLT